MKNTSKTFLAIAATLSLSAGAMAQTIDRDTGFYIGGSVGKSQIKAGNAVLDGIDAVRDTSDTGYKLLGGFQFGDNLALEAQYVNFGEYSFLHPVVRDTVKVSGFSVAGVAMLPVGNSFSLLGKLGIARMHYKEQVQNYLDGETYSAEANKITPLIGFGAEYRINEGLRVRAEYEYFGKPTVGEYKIKTSMVSVGMRYRF